MDVNTDSGDLVVGENACDGKKKVYKTFKDMFKGEFMALDMPNTKSDGGAPSSSRPISIWSQRWGSASRGRSE
jgi:benzoyl-CoA reductase/2-hydroxyglutaryl-CoA dehydratase subunit BcrC/BadD/HgdB